MYSFKLKAPLILYFTPLLHMILHGSRYSNDLMFQEVFLHLFVLILTANPQKSLIYALGDISMLSGTYLCSRGQIYALGDTSMLLGTHLYSWGHIYALGDTSMLLGTYLCFLDF